ncbi:MAG: hypothetical protein PUC21_09965 [Bacteroidales bacterium]|nr:hypothetical protein [Bacteroidales bacterium]
MKLKFIDVLIAICGMVILFSCATNVKEKETKEPVIGKYVYIDSQNVLHTKKRCYRGMTVTDKNGGKHWKPIEFVDTACIRFGHLRKLCPCCVEEEQYEILNKIAYRNYNLESSPF